mmetsp:Transcript_52890/g.113373  ORF Transcript_52890/g.113373 Transcript_52890/m.113373 type:complete len:316 (+) Transcript_52890:37-984(+)
MTAFPPALTTVGGAMPSASQSQPRQGATAAALRAPARRRRFQLVAYAFAVLAAVTLPAAFVGSFRETGVRLPRAGAGVDGSPRVTARVSNRDTMNGITIVRPQALGFKPDDEPDAREVQPVVPGFSKQQRHFFDKSTQGFPVSEVFVRFEGAMPWKKCGELTSSTGDFKEAVRSQWPILVEQSYYLSRKVRYLLPTENPIQFGYADENAEIVLVDEGPLPEGTQPLELKSMLNRCGYLAQEKPRHWQHMHKMAKDLSMKSKGNRHVKKPHLHHRKWNSKVDAHAWYNPDKYKGRYTQFMRKKSKSNIVNGNSRNR